MELILKVMGFIFILIIISSIKGNKKSKNKESNSLDANDNQLFEMNYSNTPLSKSFEKYKKNTITLKNGVFLTNEYKSQWLLPSDMEYKLLRDFNYAKSVYEKVLKMNCEDVDSENSLNEQDKSYQEHLRFYKDKFNSDREVYLKYLKDRKDKLYKAYEKVKLGRIGEDRVWDTIKSFDNCLCLRNKRLEYTENEKTKGIQMDSIIISSKGLFILEVKNLSPKGEYSVHIDRTGVWRAKYANGKEYVMNENANKQNNRHLSILNKIINTSLGTSDHRYIEAKGITVIANNVVKVDNHSSNQVVLCVDEVYNYINNFDIKYTDEQKEFLYNFIENNNKPEKPVQSDNWIYEFSEVSSIILKDLDDTKGNIKNLMLYGV